MAGERARLELEKYVLFYVVLSPPNQPTFHVHSSTPSSHPTHVGTG